MIKRKTGMIAVDIQNMQLTEADTISYDATSQVLKAAMQYVDASTGKFFAVMAKMLELQRIIQYLEHNSEVKACSFGGRQVTPEEILRDLRKYCPPKEREQLDQLLNALNMAKFYEMYRSFNTQGSSSEDNSLQEMIPSMMEAGKKLKSMGISISPEDIEQLSNMMKKNMSDKDSV